MKSMLFYLNILIQEHHERSSRMISYNGSKNENDWGLGNLDNPASILRHKGYLKAKKNKWI